MHKNGKLIQTHNQVLIDQYRKIGPYKLGPYSSETWRRDPKHLFFTLARYKFCAKMLDGKENVIEIGCGDAVGSPILLQAVKRLHGVDIEPIIIEDNIVRNEFPEKLSFESLDITKTCPEGKFDAAVSMDVIEHKFMENICTSLFPNAVCIIGTPNITASQYASPNSMDGHINLKSHDTLKALMKRYFENIFLFSMNDEVVHTGFYPMAHYLIAIGAGVSGGL